MMGVAGLLFVFSSDSGESPFPFFFFDEEEEDQFLPPFFMISFADEAEPCSSTKRREAALPSLFPPFFRQRVMEVMSLF